MLSLTGCAKLDAGRVLDRHVRSAPSRPALDIILGVEANGLSIRPRHRDEGGVVILQRLEQGLRGSPQVVVARADR